MCTHYMLELSSNIALVLFVSSPVISWLLKTGIFFSTICFIFSYGITSNWWIFMQFCCRIFWHSTWHLRDHWAFLTPFLSVETWYKWPQAWHCSHPSPHNSHNQTFKKNCKLDTHPAKIITPPAVSAIKVFFYPKKISSQNWVVGSIPYCP